jgi:hypothetical protein
MARFRVIPQSELSEQHFDEWPVWSEHYDYDEIEEIARWGVSREEAFQAFRQNERDNEHCVYTMLQANPFPPRMCIFIKASLQAANGLSLKGYVMNEDAYCLAVFSKGTEFIFSRQPMLEELNRKEEQKLRKSIGGPSSELFPMSYATDFRDSDGKVISGMFQYGIREA